MPEALILDPYKPYATMLIQRLFTRHGIRTVCLHRNWKERLRVESRLPILRSKAVAGHHMVADADWAAVARGLARRYDIVGVLPYEEGVVAPLTELAAHLGLSWAQPEVQAALRDKFALKSILRRNDPTLRLNAFAKVTSVEEVLRVVAEQDLQRYVLKPNDGSGNVDVAFFDRGADAEAVRSYFRRVDGTTLLEEYIAGSEFWVDGQTDAAGEPTVVGVGEYHRAPRNGVENLELGAVSVSPQDPRFESVCDYAVRVMRTLGLRRSPFHLELIVDDRGPCLVEVGGRFGGDALALCEMYQHGPQLDLIKVAAHYYVSDEPLGPLPLDWDNAAACWVASIGGTTDTAQRLVAVHGVDAVEKSPHFLFWLHRPLPGNYVVPTANLTSRPWALVLTGPSEVDPYPVMHWAQNTVWLEGTRDRTWTFRQKRPLYAGLARKVWISWPRPYEARALFDRIEQR